MRRRLLCLIFFWAVSACNGDITTDSQDDSPDLSLDDGQVEDSASDQAIEDMSGIDSSEDADADLGDADIDAQDAATDLPDTSWMSSGCTAQNGLVEGENTFELETRDRRYILRLPQNYSQDRAWPLVFALHGNGGNPSYWDSTSGARNIRAVLQDEAVLIIAHAIDGNWRDYGMPADTWPARVESELLYFDTILEQAKSNLCLDTREIFSMGFSGGGSFSGVLGCRRPEFRAIAVGGSVMYFTSDQCTHTPAAWITIGTEELNSGREQFRDFFRDRAGCQPATSSTAPDPCIAYDGCGPETPVHYCQHAGGHVWPDFGAQAMWDFFKTFLND